MSNILIFPGGTENGLEIKRSLENKKNIDIFSVADSLEDNSFFYYDNSYLLPNVSKRSCIDELNDLIIKCSIDFIFPANSLIIDFLVKYRDQVKCQILLTNSESVKTTRDKLKTYKLFNSKDWCPKFYTNLDEIKSKDFPLFLKPRSSYGSKGIKKINCLNDLKNIDLKNNVLTEHLAGNEVTVECFSNINGKLIYSTARTRKRIRMGTALFSDNNFTKDERVEFNDIANFIAKSIKIEGLWFFQLKKSSLGKYKLLEVECRVAGSMAYSRSNNVNLPYLQYLLFKSENLEINPNKIDFTQSRSLDLVYKSKKLKINFIYIDLDETIIVNDKINNYMINIIIKAINKNIKVVLITKSLEINLITYLKSKRIYHLFDEIIHLSESEHKYKYMNKDSIFIDNSFTQRNDATLNGIMSFDPDCHELISSLI